MGTHPCGRRRCRTRGCCTVGVFGECDPPTGPPACSTRGVLTYNPVIASASRLHVDTGPPYRVDAQKPGSHQRQRAQPPLDTTLNHSPQGCATHVTPRPRNTLQQLFRLPSASTHRTTTCSHKSNKKKRSRPAATVRSLQPLQNNDLESAAQPARQAARAPRPPTRTPHPAGRLTGWQGTGRRQRRTRFASRATPCYQPRYYLTSGPPPPRPPLDLQGLPPPPPTPPSYSTPPPPTLDPLTFLRSTFTITCPPQGGHLTTLELALHHVPLPERGGDATRAPVGLPMALIIS